MKRERERERIFKASSSLMETDEGGREGVKENRQEKTVEMELESLFSLESCFLLSVFRGIFTNKLNFKGTPLEFGFSVCIHLHTRIYIYVYR